jgi:hypothetical protein
MGDPFGKPGRATHRRNDARAAIVCVKALVIHDERGVSITRATLRVGPVEPEERKVGYVLPVHSSNRLKQLRLVASASPPK